MIFLGHLTVGRLRYLMLSLKARRRLHVSLITHQIVVNLQKAGVLAPCISACRFSIILEDISYG